MSTKCEYLAIVILHSQIIHIALAVILESQSIYFPICNRLNCRANDLILHSLERIAVTVFKTFTMLFYNLKQILLLLLIPSNCFIEALFNMSLISASSTFLLVYPDLIYTHTTKRLKLCSPCSPRAVSSYHCFITGKQQLDFH